MSGKISGLIWDCDFPQSTKFILLAYADHADHEGKNIFPSIPLIAWKTGFSERHIQRVKAELIADGILVEEGKSVRGTTLLSIAVDKLPIRVRQKVARRGDTVSPPVESKKEVGGDTIVSPGGDTIMSPEPSFNRQLKGEPNGSHGESGNGKITVVTNPPTPVENNPKFQKYPMLKKIKKANGDLLLAFWEASGVMPIAKEYTYYIKTSNEWLERKFTTEIIKKAVEKMRQDRLVISGPQSITKVATSIQALNKSTEWDQEEYERNKAILQEEHRRKKAERKELLEKENAVNG